jgi:hypothetical protein
MIAMIIVQNNECRKEKKRKEKKGSSHFTSPD